MDETPPLATDGESLTLSNSQFARLAGISESRFYQLRVAGAIPDALLSPIPRRWSRSKVEQWLAEGAPALQRTRRHRRTAA